MNKSRFTQYFQNLTALPEGSRAEMLKEVLKSDQLPEHRKKQLENDEQAEYYRFQKTKLEHNKYIADRLFTFFSMMMAAGLVVTVLFLFRDTPEMVEKILVAVGGLVAGVIGGYGIGKSKQDK